VCVDNYLFSTQVEIDAYLSSFSCVFRWRCAVSERGCYTAYSLSNSIHFILNNPSFYHQHYIIELLKKVTKTCRKKNNKKIVTKIKWKLNTRLHKTVDVRSNWISKRNLIELIDLINQVFKLSLAFSFFFCNFICLSLIYQRNEISLINLINQRNLMNLFKFNQSKKLN